MKYFTLDVVFSDCRGVTLSSGIQRLGDILAEQGFSMRIFPSAGEAGVTLKGSEIGVYLNDTWAAEINDKVEGYGNYPIPFGRSMLADGMEQLQWSFSTSYKDGHLDINLGGLVDFEFSDQSAWLVTFAQRLQELAVGLYPTIAPSLVSIDESHRRLFMRDVAKRHLKYINWVNIFGQPYVKKYGREFLLGLPGHRVEELSDGSIYYQLSSTFVMEDLKAARALRKQVIEYCAQASLKVICRAPYQLPRIQPNPQALTQPQEEEKPIPDESVRAYMQEILRTTLLLKDGTRVKLVSVPWEALTPVQVQIALDAVKAVAIDEIHQHRDKRIRLEFNQVPDELDQMLVDLAGRDNPGFEWEEVGMTGKT